MGNKPLQKTVQGSGVAWLEEYDPETQCVSIWDYAKKGAEGQAKGGVLLPKCKSLPAGVLETQYSLDAYRKRNIYKRNYFFVPDPENPGAMKQTDERVTEPSALAERFRRAIDTICDTCASQAPSEKAKEALLSKCKAVQETAPETAPASMAPDTTAPEEYLEESDFVSNPLVLLIGLLVVLGFAFAVMRSLHGSSTLTEGSLLS